MLLSRKWKPFVSERVITFPDSSTFSLSDYLLEIYFWKVQIVSLYGLLPWARAALNIDQHNTLIFSTISNPTTEENQVERWINCTNGCHA